MLFEKHFKQQQIQKKKAKSLTKILPPGNNRH